MAAMQKAVLVREIGKPVEIGTRVIPIPKEGQVLLKVTATMILPHDTYGRDMGLLIDQKLPAVLGSNIAGVIREIGAGVSKFSAGDKVFGISFPVPTASDQGGLQEYAVLNANAIGLVPDGFSDEQVVTLPINIVTSWAALFTKTGFEIPPPLQVAREAGIYDYAGTSILIIGGGSNVGQFAVQLARIAGIGKIIVVAGTSNSEKLISMGATHVIDRHSTPTDITQQLQTIVGSDGLTQVYSCAPLQLDLVVAVLSTGRKSQLRALLPLEEHEAERLKADRPLCDASFISDLTNESMAPYAEHFWAQLPRWLQDRKVLPTEYRVVQGLEQVEEINKALDAYLESTRAGPQTVVKM